MEFCIFHFYVRFFPSCCGISGPITSSRQRGNFPNRGRFFSEWSNFFKTFSMLFFLCYLWVCSGICFRSCTPHSLPPSNQQCPSLRVTHFQSVVRGCFKINLFDFFCYYLCTTTTICVTVPSEWRLYKEMQIIEPETTSSISD